MTFRFDTFLVHAGDDSTGRVTSGVPIHPASSIVFRDMEHAAAVSNLALPGYSDAATANPTTSVLEERVAALEGGAGAIATSSGQSALLLAVLTIMSTGGHIVASRSLRSRTFSLLNVTLKQLGIATTFVAPNDLDAWRNAVTPLTRLLIAESIGSLGLEALEIASLANLADQMKLPLLVDSSASTPALAKPIEQGAALVVHSCEGLMSGHGTTQGGLIVDSGRFDWARAAQFPQLTDPALNDLGLNFCEESPIAAFLMHARLVGLRGIGACLSPFCASQILLGLETLKMRVERHSRSAHEVAKHLTSSFEKLSIQYPMIGSSAESALPHAGGAAVNVTFSGGIGAAKKFMDTLKLFQVTSGHGEPRSAVDHLSSSSYARVPESFLSSTGIQPGTVRLNVGLEDVSDLLADLDRAASAALKV